MTDRAERARRIRQAVADYMAKHGARDAVERANWRPKREPEQKLQTETQMTPTKALASTHDLPIDGETPEGP